MITLLRDAGAHRNVVLAPLAYLATQLLIAHPLLSPVWLIGLGTLLARPQARFLGIAYLVLIAAMVVLHGKDYYTGDVYSIPIAAGAVTIEAWTARAPGWRPALAFVALLAGMVLFPLTMPILPEQTMSAYDRIPESIVPKEVDLAKTERTQIGALPPDWGDMHGWRELAHR